MKCPLIAAALASFLLPDSNALAAQNSGVAPDSAHASRQTDVTLGLAYHGPTRLTGSATLMWGEPRMLGAWAPAKLAQVRAGTRGAQFGLGLVAGVFEDSPFKPSGVAVTLKAIVLRTWRDPMGVTSGHTYGGLESDVVILGIRGSIGYARKVSGAGGPDGRFVWSVGLGL